METKDEENKKINEKNLRFIEKEIDMLNSNIKYNERIGDIEGNLTCAKDLNKVLENEIEILRKILKDKNKTQYNYEKEINSLKLAMTKKEEEDILKNNTIAKLNIEINKLKSMNEYLSDINKNNEAKIKEINYKIIELKQKVESNKSIQLLNTKLYSLKNAINSNEINNELHVEIAKLNQKIQEQEIQMEKINFDFKAQSNLINSINTEKENEINFLNSLHKREIINTQKHIQSLERKISDLNDSSKNKKLEEEEKKIDDILIKSKEFILNLQNYKNENKKLIQENRELKSKLHYEKIKNQENDFLIAYKDKMLQRIQIDYGALNDNYNIIKEKLEHNNMEKSNNDNAENLIKKLNEEKEELDKLNKALKKDVNKYSKDVEKVNNIVKEQKIAYEKEMIKMNNKICEYKKRIKLLKMKIDEMFIEKNINKTNNNSIEKIEFVNSQRILDVSSKSFKRNKREEVNSQEYINENKEQIKKLEEYQEILNKVTENLEKYNDIIGKKTDI